MRRTILGAMLAALLAPLAAWAQPAGGKLAEIRARGVFKCGVLDNVPGLAALDAQGRWVGFDVDYCRAMAAAILGSGEKVEFVRLTFAQALPAIRSGEIDMAAMAITTTFQRETELGLDFVGPTLFSGYGLMVTKASGVTRAQDLNGATICHLAGTVLDQVLADWFRPRGLQFRPLAFETSAQMYPVYEEGRCDAVVSEPPFLALRRSRLRDPAGHVILPDLLGKSDMGPVVREDDLAYSRALRFVHYSIVTAEELGVTQANAEEMARTSTNPGVRRLLGADGNFGAMIGLSNDYGLQVIRAVGNYAEIWDRNYGRPFGLDRGPNRLARDGGLQWAPGWR